MADNGYIKLYRKAFSNPIVMKNARYLAVWVYLLGNVSWTSKDVLFDGERITLKPGQGLFTISEIAEALDISRSDTQRILKEYRKNTMIDTQASSRNTVISILRWDEYQHSDTQFDTEKIQSRYAADTPVINLPIIKENKNIRNKECKGTTTTIPPSINEVQDFISENALTVDIQAFMDYYNANGWHVGRNKMKDWRACVRSWDRREKKKKTPEKIDIWNS